MNSLREDYYRSLPKDELVAAILAYEATLNSIVQGQAGTG
jgi:hypothetical protein